MRGFLCFFFIYYCLSDVHKFINKCLYKYEEPERNCCFIFIKYKTRISIKYYESNYIRPNKVLPSINHITRNKYCNKIWVLLSYPRIYMLISPYIFNLTHTFTTANNKVLINRRFEEFSYMYY